MSHSHFKIFKPFGMLSQLRSNDPKERKKRFLNELFEFDPSVMPVGRLDEKSEGLLLLTTDGKLSDRINRSGVEKEYWVQLDGCIDPNSIERLKTGVEIGLSGSTYKTQPCQASILEETPLLPLPDPRLRIGRHRPSCWISIVLKEGKFRQVRKMTAAIGFPTLRLVRVRIGNVFLGDLRPGEVIPLKELTI
jgi:23S rRNA pseudouridine2457 synthase